MPSTSAYPIDCSSCMTEDGPEDDRFQIPGGTLLYNAGRDERFPYIYKLTTHALVHAPEFIKTILVHIVDTSIEERIRQAKFIKTLSVPLGPDAIMNNYGPFHNLNLLFIIFEFHFYISMAGLLELEPGTILFARPLREDGVYLEENDIAEAWCLDGYVGSSSLLDGFKIIDNL